MGLLMDNNTTSDEKYKDLKNPKEELSESEKERIKNISDDLFKVVKRQIKHYDSKIKKLLISDGLLFSAASEPVFEPLHPWIAVSRLPDAVLGAARRFRSDPRSKVPYRASPSFVTM